eukprot:scaffold370305_cov39-Prasinocladus_malaysianus.AAC.1
MTLLSDPSVIVTRLISTWLGHRKWTLISKIIGSSARFGSVDRLGGFGSAARWAIACLIDWLKLIESRPQQSCLLISNSENRCSSALVADDTRKTQMTANKSSRTGFRWRR